MWYIRDPGEETGVWWGLPPYRAETGGSGLQAGDGGAGLHVLQECLAVCGWGEWGVAHGLHDGQVSGEDAQGTQGISQLLQTGLLLRFIILQGFILQVFFQFWITLYTGTSNTDISEGVGSPCHSSFMYFNLFCSNLSKHVYQNFSPGLIKLN